MALSNAKKQARWRERHLKHENGTKLRAGIRRPSTDPFAKPPFDTLQAKNLDASVILATLEALLTGRDYDEIMKGPRQAHLSAGQDDYHLQVLTVTDEIQAAPAIASNKRLTGVAVTWSQTEEMRGADPEGLAGVLEKLAGLARRATERNERLYRWICI
jgi:hypothetical protein